MLHRYCFFIAALEHAISRVRANQEGLKWNGTHHCAGGVYIMVESMQEIQTGMWSAVTRPPCRLLSPSNILPPPSSHSTVIPARKISTHISKYLFLCFTFYKIV